MRLRVKRSRSGEKSTIGSLYLNEVFFCYTLEDVVRPDPNLLTAENEAKVWGQTAIPAGEYDVEITSSQRFKRDLPILLNVPGFEGIRIHPGNTAEDTHGCILVGTFVADADHITGSRNAFDRLFEKLLVAKRKNEAIVITIEDAP